MLLPNEKVKITPTGLHVSSELTFEEWGNLATSIGNASRSVAFVIGDWLVYGQTLFGPDAVAERRVSSEAYLCAIAATGLDLSTLQNYAYVSRSVPISLRNERLSWEHHRILAKLPQPEQQQWIDACVAEEDSGQRMSTRRLRKSLNLGRVATEDDMEPEPADKGIDNHIPFVNRLSVWWKRMGQNRFLDTATRDQREALKRDLEPVVSIYNQL
jgi:hypothetical protein